MSIWPASGTAPALFGVEGELVLLYVDVEPKLLEELLEALSRLEFPVNPDLHHKSNQVTVTFPAYSGRLNEIRETLARSGFDASCITVEHLLAAHA